MSLSTLITDYLRPPFRVCNAPLATALAEAGQQRLMTINGLAAEQYSIANCLYPATALGDSPVTLKLSDKLPLVELPELPRLGGFYDEHGLEPLPYDELLAVQASAKLQAAWHLLASVPTVQAGMRALIKTIQVLRSPDPDIDISYSHPTVPFSVFVTVGEDCSVISSLRVAESLLHEAMHLKLTLIEQEVILVQPNSQSLFYSPWRDELRPVRGVLHGIFVFVAVREFYQQIRQHVGASPAATFVTDRIESITQELELVCDFSEAPDLTDVGKVLARSLLSLEKALESH